MTTDYESFGGIPVEVEPRTGGTVWLRIDAWDRSTARVVAEDYAVEHGTGDP